MWSKSKNWQPASVRLIEDEQSNSWIQKDIERIEQQLKKQNDGDEKK